MRPTFIAAASVAALLTVSGQAQAQANRTFVSGEGSDNNPCSRAAPCRTFAQAINQTNAAGEIVVLDSAGYGALTIAKSITITNPGGVEAGITAAAGETAITIANTAAAIITLRGLTLEGGGVGVNGIVVASAVPQKINTTVNILDCVVKDFTGSGVILEPTLASGSLIPFLYATIADSSFLNNAGNGFAVGSSTTINVLASVYRSIFNGNGIGVDVTMGGVFLFNSHMDANNSSGVSIGANGFAQMTTSTALNTVSGTDVNNSGNIFLFQRNAIGGRANPANFGTTDGTNDYLVTSGSALSKRTLQ